MSLSLLDLATLTFDLLNLLTLSSITMAHNANDNRICIVPCRPKIQRRWFIAMSHVVATRQGSLCSWNSQQRDVGGPKGWCRCS